MRLFFCAIMVVKEVPLPVFDTEFGTIPNKLDKHAAPCGFDPRCRQWINPVERCIWRFAGLFVWNEEVIEMDFGMRKRRIYRSA